MPQGDLNTTSFLVLGMLTSRDWSAYEIAEVVGRGVAEVWPRADRQRYNAPKRLLERGLVEARTEMTGRRQRTIYSITPEGRRALREWLAEAPQRSALEFEGMIRVMLAEQGSLEDLRRTLRTIAEQSRQSRALFVAHARTLQADEAGTFPERNHLMALANRFMIGHFNHMAEWAGWALEQTETWSDTTAPATAQRAQTQAVLAESIELGTDES